MDTRGAQGALQAGDGLETGMPMPVVEQAGPDTAFAIVQYLARRWQRTTARDVILAGLPLEDGRLPAGAIPAALERISIIATPTPRRLKDLSDFEFPAIVTLPDARLVVALGLERRGKVRIYDPAEDGERVEPVGIARAGTAILLISPVFERATGAAGEETGRRHWLSVLFAGNWGSVLHVVLAASFINMFAIAFPLFTLNVYDRVLPNAATATLWVLAAGLGIVLVFDFLLKLARAAIIDHVGRRIDFRLGSQLFARVVNTPLDSRPGSTGTFVNRIAQYEVLRDFFTSSTLATFIDVVFMGIFAWVIFSLIGWIVVFPLAAALFVVIATIVIGLISGKAVEAAQAEAAARNSILVESLSSPQTVKAARMEGQLLRRWESTIHASSRTQNAIKWYQAVATNLTGLASQLSMVAIIIAGTYTFAEGEISMGAIIAAMMLSNRLIAPIGQVAAMILRARHALDAFRTISGIMDLPDERFIGKGFVDRRVNRGKVDIRKLRFAYPGSTLFVLDDVSLSIAPGEKVGIIGKIGSGKTTLGRLLVGFHTPTEGEILLDDVALGQYHPATLRREIGLLIQEPELFEGSVRQNILMADPMAGEGRLLEVAQRAGVDGFVSRHPMGYDMPVGERGCLLSGGQRQAVALARTLLADPKVLFLDEPTSSMDIASERQLIARLNNNLRPEHTVLIATHRYSLLSLVTRLIVIDNGRIVADGPSERVLKDLQAAAGGRQ